MYECGRYFYGINPVKVYDLKATGQGSYYGKAKVVEDESGEIFLRSYDTLVCYINKDGELKRLWDGYSSTTMKHVNDFLKLFELDGGGKKWWMSLEVERH